MEIEGVAPRRDCARHSTVARAAVLDDEDGGIARANPRRPEAPQREARGRRRELLSGRRRRFACGPRCARLSWVLDPAALLRARARSQAREAHDGDRDETPHRAKLAAHALKRSNTRLRWLVRLLLSSTAIRRITVRMTQGATSVQDARNPELEAAIVADPTNREAFSVYADWLQERGDPRGELISLHLSEKGSEAQAFLEEHIDYFLGQLAEHQEVYDAGLNNSASHLRTPAEEEAWQKTHKQAFLWRNGFIHRVRLSHDIYSHEDWEGKTVEVLEMVLAHPSARFASEFAFMSNGDPSEDDLQDLVDLLGQKAPPTTRRIILGDNVDQISWHHVGSLASLWRGVPQLRVLEIETGSFEVGKMVAPALERAIFITGGLSKSCGKDIATASMPAIQHLEIYYGTPNYGGTCTIDDVRPLLERTDLPRLEYLGLKNSEFADDIARSLDGADILKSVKTLDLSLGMMTDDGARALVTARGSLAHLDCLDLRENYLTSEGIEMVQGLCRQVLSDGQKDTTSNYRYVTIAE